MGAIASTEAFAEYRGVAHDPADVHAIRTLEVASDLVRAEIDLDVDAATDDSLTLDGSGLDTLILPELPVSDIASVTLDDVELVVDDEYRLGAGGILYRTDDDVWTLGRGNVEVVYSHGWDTPPEGLVNLVLLVADRLYASAGTGGEVESETIGVYSYTTSTTDTDPTEALTADERKLAQRFRAVRLG